MKPKPLSAKARDIVRQIPHSIRKLVVGDAFKISAKQPTGHTNERHVRLALSNFTTKQ